MSYMELARIKADNLISARHARILAIESSCDETAAAIVEDGRTVLSNVIASQVETHALYGGVVPEIASRQHIEACDAVVQRALDDANVRLSDLDAIAVTYGPGLVGALLILLLFALLIVRGYWIALHARDRFGALTITGLISLLAIQVFLNIGVVSNLLPSTGIGLPFFSYGGTALWINLAEMGIILGVSRQNTNNIRTAEKRKKRKNTGGNAHARNVHLRRNRRPH